MVSEQMFERSLPIMECQSLGGYATRTSLGQYNNDV